MCRLAAAAAACYCSTQDMSEVSLPSQILLQLRVADKVSGKPCPEGALPPYRSADCHATARCAALQTATVLNLEGRGEVPMG